MSAPSLLNRVAEAGVAVWEGHLPPGEAPSPRNRQIDALIVNGSECEPLPDRGRHAHADIPGETIEGVRIAL